MFFYPPTHLPLTLFKLREIHFIGLTNMVPGVGNAQHLSVMDPFLTLLGAYDPMPETNRVSNMFPKAK